MQCMASIIDNADNSTQCMPSHQAGRHRLQALSNDEYAPDFKNLV